MNSYITTSMVTKEQEAYLDFLMTDVGRVPIANSFGHSFYGVDMLSRNSIPLPRNTTSQGLIFFTKPLLNLSDSNLLADRRTSPIATGVKNSIQRAVRAYLDPLAARGDNPIDTPLVDNKCAFIPILTNYLTSFSGWPDLSIDTYTSSEGLFKEQWSMIDGIKHNWQVWNTSMSFRNVAGDPITSLIWTWLIYAASVYDGSMDPRMDAVVKNYIDYQTGIYRITLSYDGRVVQDIAKTIAFPTAISIGARFNYSRDNRMAEVGDQIDVPFTCIGAEYNDPVLMREFNAVVTLFNPEMETSRRVARYVYVEPRYRPMFNHIAYPYINLDTNEFQWWVSRDLFIEKLPGLAENIQQINREATNPEPKWLMDRIR